MHTISQFGMNFANIVHMQFCFLIVRNKCYFAFLLHLCLTSYLCMVNYDSVVKNIFFISDNRVVLFLFFSGGCILGFEGFLGWFFSHHCNITAI